jgi:enterochelin esterase-like enzyme
MKPATKPIIVLMCSMLCMGMLASCVEPLVVEETHIPVEWTIITVKTATPTPKIPTATSGPTAISTSTTTPTPLPPHSTPVCDQDEGDVRDDALESAIMKRTIKLKVYLPPCYEPDRVEALPVLYLLHGLGADNNQWVELGIP